MNFFSHINLDQIFKSKEEFDLYQEQKLTPQDSNFISKNLVEHLIIFNKPVEKIKEIAEKKIKENGSYLNASRNSAKLTLLHLAVILNNRVLVEWLDSKGASCVVQDVKGWTAVHHSAVLMDNGLYKYFSSKIKGDHPKTELGANIKDLRAMVGLEKVNTTKVRIFIEIKGQQEEFDSSNKEHLDLMGVEEYSDYLSFKGEKRKCLWSQKKVEGDSTKFNIDLLYSSIFRDAHNPDTPQNQRATVIVKTGSLLQGLIPFARGVFAGCDIKNHTGLFTYGGLYFDEDVSQSVIDIMIHGAEHSRYLLYERDASKVGNVARLVNDGFPNCRFEDMSAYRGSSLWPLLVVTNEEGIQKGEEIVWNYGPGEIGRKWGIYEVIGSERMLKYFKKVSDIEKEIQDIENQIRTYSSLFNKNKKYTEDQKNLYFSAWDRYEKMAYVLCTPAAFLTLYCSELAKPEKWKNTLSNWSLYRRSNENLNNNLKYMEAFFIFIMAFDQACGKKESITGWISRYDMHTVTYGMYLLMMEETDVEKKMKKYNFSESYQSHPVIKNFCDLIR